MRVLSLSLRPRSLSHLFGQEALVKSLRHHVATRPPQCWLLHGGTGTGKTTLARIMSVAYQCTHQKLWGDPCEVCWRDQSGFAISEINASEVSGVEELGKVATMSRSRPLGCEKRVIILDEFQRVTSAAQNLLLKPMEEPPSTTIWILCTTDPAKILPTLRRRCTTYQLKSLGFTECERFLQKAAAVVKIQRPLKELVEQVHFSGINSPALLLQALEKYAAGSTAEESIAGSDGVSLNSLHICKAVTAGNWKAVKESLANASPDEARWITSSVAGWLRALMVKETDFQRLEKIAASLYDLSTNVPLEDSSRIIWLWPILWKISKRFQGAR